MRGPDGAGSPRKGPPIHALTLAELTRYDIGRINPAVGYARQFPQQQPVDGERFPTLDELFALRQARQAGAAQPRNQDHARDAGATLDAATFARLTVEAIRPRGCRPRTTIQSFDWRTLVEAKKLAPEIATACLTIESANDDTVHAGRGRPLAVARRPRSRRPRRLVAAPRQGGRLRHVVAVLAQRRAERDRPRRTRSGSVLPWTVNDPADMARLVDMGVDGLITDYPDRARKVMADEGVPLP